MCNASKCLVLFLDIMESPTFRKLGDLLENLFEFDDECDAPSFHDLGESCKFEKMYLRYMYSPQGL